MDAKRYSEQETALILQRAAQLQADGSGSLSLSELEGVAVEAGIDRALVRRAAADLDAAPSTALAQSPSGWSGPAARWKLEHTVAGEMSIASWEHVTALIRSHLGDTGRVEGLGRQFLWSGRTGNQGRNVRISVTPRAGKTVIRVEESHRALATGLYTGIGIGGVAAGLGFILPICIAALRLPALIPVALVAWGALMFYLARSIYVGAVAKREVQLGELSTALVGLCAELAEPPDES